MTSAAALLPPLLNLPTTTAGDYCSSVLSTRGSEVWWFQIGAAPYRGYSRPFRDLEGRWWWRSKPQFSYPMDLFVPIDPTPQLPRGRSIVGCQYPVPEECANSLLHFNVIANLDSYDLDAVAAAKHRAVRKGLNSLTFHLLDARDNVSTEEVRLVWDSHVSRTRWNRACGPRTFKEWWQPLADMPGTSIVGVRERVSGQLCAWLLVRIIDNTVFLDTLASRTDMLMHRPNDALIFFVLFSTGRTHGGRRANFFRRSSATSIELFKQSVGFDSTGLPARYQLNRLTRVLPKLLKPKSWDALRGDWNPR